MTYQVKDVASLAGISVRTLHHYDQIKLLTPTSTSPAGYRLYTEEDLERLQQILFFKEIGFSLLEIKDILDRSDFDRKAALESHKSLLLEKRMRLDTILHTIDLTLESIEGGNKMDNKEMFQGFDVSQVEDHKQKYAEETRQKYDPARVAESERRTSSYSKADWARILEEANDIYRKIASFMNRDVTDAEVQAAVAEWHAHINTYYYDCPLEIFRGLGDMYVADERFTRNIDKFGAGLSQYLRDAMHAYCDGQSERE